MSQALSVAKKLVRLSLSGIEPDPLTNLRLQKLLYYAQAWSLIVRASELFPDDLEAWRHGPVVPTVYRALPDCQGANQIAPDAFSEVPDLEEEEAEFVERVWEAYNEFSALRLSRMTHDEMPWRKAWGNRPLDSTGNDPISMSDLEEFFAAQTMPAPLAAYQHQCRRKEEEALQELAGMPPLDVPLLTAASRSFTPSVKRP